MEELAGHPTLNQQGTFTEIGVKNNGIGFYEKYAGQVFDLFQRLYNRDHYAGTGIGLALCRKIVLQHSGKIYKIEKVRKYQLSSHTSFIATILKEAVHLNTLSNSLFGFNVRQQGL